MRLVILCVVGVERTLRDWLWFGGWAVVGLGVAFGLVSFPLALPFAALVAWLLGRGRRRVEDAWGAITGVGLLLCFTAYVQRHGPGQYCHSIGTRQYPGTECGDYSDPRPLLVAGLVLAAAGVVGFIVHRSAQRPRSR